MSAENVSVFFRLPGSEQLECLREGEGSGRFVLAPFLREEGKTILSGSILNSDDAFMELCLDAWQARKPLQIRTTPYAVYEQMIDKALQAIQDGRFEKTVLAVCRCHPGKIRLSVLFRNLLREYPQAFVYAFAYNGVVMLGATPETLLQRKGNELYTEALGGTRTRGTYSDKEWKEHQQIREYIREVLELKNYTYSEGTTISRPAAAVEHLSTPFRADSAGVSADLALADSLHPTSAVCGLPFHTALDFIRETEPFSRDYYSGYLGPVRENGDFQFFVNLRCARWWPEGIVMYAGAGINALSLAEDEWEEVNNKMQTIARCLK